MSKLEQLPFNRFKSNIYSQGGEDGIIEELLIRIFGKVPVAGVCVEFGAWDGMHFSNTFKLVEQYEWHALYIEGDSKRFEDLKATAIRFPRIRAVNAFVAQPNEEPNNLGELIRVQNFDESFELLSIDIDSYDLDVWEGLTHFQPITVVIEINSGIFPGIVLRHGQGMGGSSFSATLAVAKTKGYTLACHNGNMFFVRNDKVKKLLIDKRYLIYPELLFDAFSNKISMSPPIPTIGQRLFWKFKKIFVYRFRRAFSKVFWKFKKIFPNSNSQS
jgi:hypothetical protein